MVGCFSFQFCRCRYYFVFVLDFVVVVTADPIVVVSFQVKSIKLIKNLK